MSIKLDKRLLDIREQLETILNITPLLTDNQQQEICDELSGCVNQIVQLAEEREEPWSFVGSPESSRVIAELEADKEQYAKTFEYALASEKRTNK